MRKILVILCLSSLFTISARASITQINDSTELKNEDIKLETRFRRESIQILFWQHHHYKGKIIDEIVTSDFRVILKAKSLLICSEDVCDEIKFNRLVVKGNQILKYRHWLNFKYGRVITYDVRGKKTGKEKVLYDDMQESFGRLMQPR